MQFLYFIIICLPPCSIFIWTSNHTNCDLSWFSWSVGLHHGYAFLSCHPLVEYCYKKWATCCMNKRCTWLTWDPFCLHVKKVNQLKLRFVFFSSLVDSLLSESFWCRLEFRWQIVLIKTSSICCCYSHNSQSVLPFLRHLGFRYMYFPWLKNQIIHSRFKSHRLLGFSFVFIKKLHIFILITKWYEKYLLWRLDSWFSEKLYIFVDKLIY